MRKRRFAAILAAVLIFVQASAIFGIEPVNVALDGILLQLEHGAINEGGRTMVDGMEMERIFGWNRRLGRVLVPLREVADDLGLEIFWDGSSNLVRLYSGGPQYALLDGRLQEQGNVHLTLLGALERINARDEQLGTIAVNMTILERERRPLDDHFEARRDFGVPLEGRQENYYNANEIELLTSMEEFDHRELVLEYNRRLVMEGNEMAVRSALANVERAELEVILLEAQLDFENQNLDLMRVMHGLGLESEAALRDAASDLETATNNLAAAHIVLSDHHLALNNILGLSQDAVVSITDHSWNLYVPPLGRHLDDILTTAPNMRLRQLDLDMELFIQRAHTVLLREGLRDMYYYHNERRQDSTAVIRMRNNVNSAQNLLDVTRANLERQVRTAYDNIRQAEEQIRVAQANLQAARVDYSDIMRRYLSGLASRAELHRAELNILNREVALARLNIDRGMMIMNYHRAYL